VLFCEVTLAPTVPTGHPEPARRSLSEGGRSEGPQTLRLAASPLQQSLRQPSPQLVAQLSN
jgi:hypothetical protein